MSARPKRSIPRWRRALYALLVLGLLLGVTEGVCRLLARELPQGPPAYTDVETFITDYGNRTRQPWFIGQDGPLPGAQGPKVVLRVDPAEPGALPFEGAGGKVKLLLPAQLPGQRQVLVLGASAAYGDGVKHAQTLARQLQGLVAGQRPALSVLNLARPAWELNSVSALLQRLLKQLPRPPAAVVLYSGNNEFSVPPIFSVGENPLKALAAYRVAVHQASRRGWLPPPPGTDFSLFRNPRWEAIASTEVLARLWRPGAGLDDMSYWTRVRTMQLAQYKAGLVRVTTLLRQRKIPLVLVPPPVNLHFFVGSIYPQPVTYQPGRQRYLSAARRLELALQTRDEAALRQLVRDEPGGPLQRYALGQLLDQAGKHQLAAAELSRARDSMMGLLAALPAMARLAAELAGPSVAVVDSAGFYPPGVSVRQRSRQLFNDSCHPSATGHRLLAREVARQLTRLGVTGPSASPGPADE